MNEDIFNTTSFSNETLYGERGIVTSLATIIYGVLTFTLFVIGGTLNLLIFITIMRMNEKRDLIMIYISAFCLTDMLSTIISPFWWYRSTIGYEHYKLPHIMCKLSMMGITTSLISTSLLIFTLACIRYHIMKNPLGRVAFTSTKIKVLIVCIFLLALVIGILTGLGWEVRKENGWTVHRTWYGDCTQNRDEWITMGRILSVGVYPVLIIIPMIIVFILSVLMIYHLRTLIRSDVLSERQLADRDKKEKHISIQFLLIVLGFMIGYIPLLGNIARKAFGVAKDTVEDKRFDHDVSVSIYLIQRFAEMLNPCLYLIGSSTLRRRVKNYIRSSIISSSCRDEEIISRSESSTASKQTQQSAGSNRLPRKDKPPVA